MDLNEFTRLGSPRWVLAELSRGDATAIVAELLEKRILPSVILTWLQNTEGDRFHAVWDTLDAADLRAAAAREEHELCREFVDSHDLRAAAQDSRDEARLGT